MVMRPVNPLRRVAFVLLAAALLFSVEARAQKFNGRELVQASLIADTSAVVPGKPFTAGLLLKMVPGWHTYWQYPGDAGIPTELKWNLPNELENRADPMADPAQAQRTGRHPDLRLPRRSAAYVAAHAAGEDREKNPRQLAADADWLVCEKVCIPGSAKVQLNLPVGGFCGAGEPGAFSRKFRAQLPQPLPNESGAALHWSRTAKDFRLTIADKNLAQNPTLDFFPLPESPTVIGHPKRETAADGSVVFVIPIETADAEASNRSTACSFSIIRPGR